MAVQLSVNARNAGLDAYETELNTGGAGVLKIFSGAQPANCAAANSGTVLATITLPADPFAAASSGTKALQSGPWTDASADATGTAGHFRFFKNDGTTCVMQGSVGQGTGDLQVDNTSFVAGQQFSITAFTMTAGNA